MLLVINEAKRLKKEIDSIHTNEIEFTPDGTKYIWKEPMKPANRK